MFVPAKSSSLQAVKKASVFVLLEFRVTHVFENAIQ
jgi:hypothetical protein